MPLLQSLIGLFELPEDESTPDDEHFIEIEDTPGIKAKYLSNLKFIRDLFNVDNTRNVTIPLSDLFQIMVAKSFRPC